jgi:hypothetical protein
MRVSRFLFQLLVWAVLIAPVHASDPLRLKDNFRLLDVSPYMQNTANGGHVFAVQNGGSQTLNLILKRLPQNDLAVALGLSPTAPPALRLFSSDDREFASKPGQSELLRFDVPANAVQSFYLPPGTLGATPQGLYLWSPSEHAAQENRRQTFRSSLMLLLAVLTVAAIAASVMRRSRRAAFAVVMGLGLSTLLGSLWMRDIAPVSLEYLLADRVFLIRLALGIGVVMSLLAHVNLLLREVLNRNYWTRVIIVTDILLAASALLWLTEITMPGFAGLLSVELAHMGLAATSASVFLGAIFVPDRTGED